MSVDNPNPKLVDQPEKTPGGRLAENGKFHAAANAYKSGNAPPDRVCVYEKIKKGIWSYNGVFHLIDSWTERDDHRSVFKLILISVEGDEDFSMPVKPDGGRCVKCGQTDELHFDHILPYAKGGTSITPENVQLLCMRHNLQKSDKIL